MNDSEARVEELNAILGAASSAKVRAEALNALVHAEATMSENRCLLVTLFERGVIAESVLSDGIVRCFDLFLRDAVNLIGKKNCRLIYDYLPGEQIGFLGLSSGDVSAQDPARSRAHSKTEKVLVRYRNPADTSQA